MTDMLFFVFIVAGWLCLTYITIYVAKGGLRRRIKVSDTTEEKILSKLHNLICNDHKDPDGWDVLQVRRFDTEGLTNRLESYYVDLTRSVSFWIRRDMAEKCVEIEISGTIGYKIKQVVFKTTDRRAHQIMDELSVRYNLLKEWGDK